MRLPLPEVYFSVVALIFMVLALRKDKECLPWALPLTLAFVGWIICLGSLTTKGILFAGTYQINLFSQVFKCLLAFGFLIITLMGNKGINQKYLASYYLFLTLSLLGLFLLVSSVELITLFVALELSSYALYVAIAFRKDSRWDKEAAMKYALFGGVISGIMLFGMGYVLFVFKTPFLKEIVLKASINSNLLAIFGFILLIGGFFYKLTVFPFHFWSPDVYQGASNETTPFVATLPKVAVVAVLLRLLSIRQAGTSLIDFLVMLAAFSMTFGNLVALVQHDLKRLLAYSSIAHAGYLLMGFLAFNNLGTSAVFYYIAAYLFMNLACFYVIVRVSRRGENVTFEHLKGLYKTAPWLAATLAVGALALAGIPPTMGFTGKLFLFTAAFKAGHSYLVVLAAINCAISLFYYLNMVRYAYTKEAEDTPKIPMTIGDYAVSIGFMGSIILLGILPGPVFKILSKALTNIF